MRRLWVCTISCQATASPPKQRFTSEAVICVSSATRYVPISLARFTAIPACWFLAGAAALECFPRPTADNGLAAAADFFATVFPVAFRPAARTRIALLALNCLEVAATASTSLPSNGIYGIQGEKFNFSGFWNQRL